jgi:hypothetical protein
MSTEIEWKWEDCTAGIVCPVCKDNGMETVLIADSQNEKATCGICGKFEYQLSAKIVFTR